MLKLLVSNNIFSWLFVLGFLATNIRAQEIDYSIDATLNIKEKSIEISQQINFTNPGKERTNILYLQDWVNAYRDTETPLAKRFSEDFNRKFYLSSKSKLGFTQIDTIKGIDYSLEWNRIEKQPDIIKVVLPKFIEPGETTTLFLSYVIKIPDSKFTGMGINDNGRVYLNHWNISVAPFIKGSWLLTSNLDLNDFSGNPANYEITWHYPKNYFLNSNLLETETTVDGVNKHSIFNDNRRIQADFVFDTTNYFTTIKLENGKEVITDLLPPDKNAINLKNTLERIIQYADTIFTPFPNEKVMILKSSYDKNPFYGLNQLQTTVKISKNNNIDIKFFSDTFFYEIKFLKAYFGRYLNQNLLIDKRKYHWIIGGIQTYAMIKYIEEFYPDEKMLGSLADFKILNLKLLNNYSASKIKFNDAYEFIYEFVEHSNIHQTDKLSKDKLSKFNEKIGSPNHVGVGLRYIETSQQTNWLPEIIKTYLSSNGSIDFEELLRSGDQNIDWFLKDYLGKRKSFDIKIRGLEKLNDSIRFSVISRDQRKIPVLVGLIKNDKVIKEQWVTLSKSDTIITWEQKKADFIAINPYINFPEGIKSNNWRPINTPLGIKPLKFTLIKDSENLKKEQILFHPVFDFNIYDGITSGIRFYNSRIKNRAFEFDFHPQYSFIEKDIVGFFKVDYKLFKAESKNYLTRFRVSGSSFHYDTNYRYSVLIPSITWSFRPKNIRDNKRQYLLLAWYNVFREKSLNVISNPDYSILNLRHILTRNNTIDYFSTHTNIELSNTFSKIQFTGEVRKLFSSGRQLSARLFAGKFLWHNALENQFFDFNLNRPSDYLFQYRYLGRSETAGIYSQQFIPAEGGFKSIFAQSTANDYMASLNISMGVWKWIELYGDIGVLKNYNSDLNAYFDSGIKLNFSPDYLEIYLPIFSSNGFEFMQPKFAAKIRFNLDPSFSTLTSLFTRKWF